MGNSLRIRGEPRSPGRHGATSPPNILQVRAGEQRDVVLQRDGFRNGVSESWSAGGKYEDGEYREHDPPPFDMFDMWQT